MEPEEYCELITASALTRTVETIPTVSAIGRIAVEDVCAEAAVPAFATSAMDGFALDESALRRAQSGAAVTVSGDIPAGALPVEIETGTAVRVMTGAQVPATAEVVVPVEFTDADRTAPAPASIRASAPYEGLRPGWNIRAVGEDTRVGDTVIHAGQLISSAGVGTLAMMGRESVRVERTLTIGIIVTGDELRTHLTGDRGTDVVQPFIHNSNLPMLSSAITDTGAVPVERSCGDDQEAFRAILTEFEGRVDLIITTGGISAGAFEVVRQVLGAEHSRFLRLALRPGGPQGYGRFGDTPLLHLPGTPTGAFLSFQLFARSLIEARPLRSRWKKALYAGPEILGHPKAVSLVPGRYAADGEVECAQRSRLRDFSDAEVVVRVPRGPESIGPGDAIEILDC